ncbi:MAG: hypothetical protein JXB14_04275 [Candidatus Altiarchaeota archaeon]|nr:hypothetical protein [Candidatus Altiarchaeota archaeon]
MVHRMLLVRIGGKYVHLLKMFGALFTFGCAFNVLFSAYQLSVAVDNAEWLYRLNNISSGDMFGQITGPIASIFIWLALMVLGLSIYRSDRTVLPLEEDWEDTSAPKSAQRSAPRTGARMAVRARSASGRRK